MQNHRTSFVLSALAASLALTLSPANAQTSSSTAQADNNRPSANATYKTDQKAAKSADEAWQRTHRASKIIGTEVRNAQGQKVGKVKDLVLEDPANGRISQVVIAVGGVLGMGDKLFAVPYEQVQMVDGQKYVVLSANSDLSQTFDEKHWPLATTRTAGTTTPSASTDRTSGVAMSPNATSSATTASPSTSTATSTDAATASPSVPSASSSASAPSPATTSPSSTDTTSSSSASPTTTTSPAMNSPTTNSPPPTTGSSSTSSPSSTSSASSTPSSSSSSSTTSGSSQ